MAEARRFEALVQNIQQNAPDKARQELILSCRISMWPYPSARRISKKLMTLLCPCGSWPYRVFSRLGSKMHWAWRKKKPGIFLPISHRTGEETAFCLIWVQSKEKVTISRTISAPDTLRVWKGLFCESATDTGVWFFPQRVCSVYQG